MASNAGEKIPSRQPDKGNLNKHAKNPNKQTHRQTLTSKLTRETY